MGFFEELRAKLESIKNGKQKPTEEPPTFVEQIGNVCSEPFFGPLKAIPRNRTEVYEIYGRAEKDTNSAHKTFPKAKMTIAENLPGSWNNNKPRLYMLGFMEDYLREALSRCKRLDVLDYITRMGCYNHRHIQYDSSMPLSYHSWGAAVDINSDDNGLIYFSKKPIGPPFSKQWYAVYPKSVPFALVKAFQSVGFTWGGDFNAANESWTENVWKSGDRYDAGDDPSKWPKWWTSKRYTDPMHFELIK